MTIKDIAKQAGVSPSTVSKIINGKADNIRPSTREKVMEIVKRNHYSTSDFIKRSSSASSFKLGFLVNRAFSNDVLMHSLVSTSRQMGYFPVISFSDNNSAEEKRFLDFLESDGADGILWERVDRTENLSQISGTIPKILINEDSSAEGTQIPYDTYGYHAANILIALGHRRIAFIADRNQYTHQRLFDGIQNALLANRIPPVPTHQFFSSEQPAIDLIKSHFTAAICVDRSSALLLSRQLSQLNYSLPDDFSILVITNSDEPEKEFSTISVPFREYGSFLIRRMIQMINHEEPLESFSLPPLPTPTRRTIGTPRNSQSRHLLVVGSIHIDVNLGASSLPRLGSSVSVSSMITLPGGKGLNQAIGLAKLKKDVYLIARVGSDYDGITAQNTLSHYCVRTDGIIRDESDTGRAFIYIMENGESAISAFGGANQNMNVGDLQKNRRLFSNAAFCLLQTEIPMEVVEAAAHMAKENDVPVILKPASVNQLNDDLLPFIDYFVPNENELRTLCPQLSTNEERCQYFLDKGVGTVILTLGGKGCYLRTSTESRYFPASNHIAVDTTGGCDAFISALATFLAEGSSIKKAIFYANQAAGFCVSQLGVVPALIGRDALDMYPYTELEGE